MTGNSQKRTTDSDTKPIIIIIKQIQNILNTSKAHSYAHGIYYSIEMLIKILVVPHHKPQHQELETLLWYRSPEESICQLSHNGRALLIIQSNLRKRYGEKHRQRSGKHAVEQSLHQLSCWLRIIIVLFVNEVQRDKYWQQSRYKYQCVITKHSCIL